MSVELMRSINQYDSTKKTRNSAKHQIPPASQASPGPGPWLTNIIDERVGLDEANLTEEQQSALEIASAYRLVPRHRTLKYPMGPHPAPRTWFNPKDDRPDPPAKIFITDEVETLETRSMCFGVGVREPKDESAPFDYMNQSYVLSGRHEQFNPDKGQWNLQDYLRTHKSLVSLSNALEVETTTPEVGAEALYVWTADGDEDLRDVLVDVSEVEEQVEPDEEEDDEEEQPAPVPVSASCPVILTKVAVSDEELRAHYATW